MSRGDITRRELLRRAGAAAGVAAVGSTAGCSAMPCIAGFGGCGGAYRQWLPEPGTLWSRDHYKFSLVDYTTFADNEDEFDYLNTDEIEDRWVTADIDWEDVSMYLWFNGLLVIEAGFDQDEVVEDFEDEGFDDDGTHEGYEIMVEHQFAVGVGSGTIVENFTARDDPVDVVEDVVDTKKGSEDRYVDESDDFAALTDKLGSGDYVYGETMEETDTDNPENGEFENQVAEGRRFRINGSTTEARIVRLFEDGDDLDTEDVEDWIETDQDNDGWFDDWEDTNVNKNGRAAVINGTIDTDEIW